MRFFPRFRWFLCRTEPAEEPTSSKNTSPVFRNTKLKPQIFECEAIKKERQVHLADVFGGFCLQFVERQPPQFLQRR